MTNPIKSDMTTPSIQMLKEWHRDIAKAAFEQGVSFGQKVRELLLVGAELEDPELAAKLREARAKRFVTNTLVVLVGLTAVCQTTLNASETKRRKPRSAGRPCPVRRGWTTRNVGHKHEIFIAA